MKILFDNQIFDDQERGGISRYHAELYKGLIRNGIDAKIGLKNTNNIYLKDFDPSINKQYGDFNNFLPNKNFKGKYKLYKLYSFLCNKKDSYEINSDYFQDLLDKDFDILHTTTYSQSFKNISKPIVVTIHDMIYESYPEYFNDLSVIKQKYDLAQNATKIIAISEYTKKEILKYYQSIDPDKICVVHHGIDLDIKEDFYDNELDFPYLLFVGNRYAYKNFSIILKALSVAKKNNKSIKLLCIGSKFTPDELLYINFLGLSDDIIIKNNVSDKQLRTYYKYATFYISSSVSEGFGLPLLEAMKYKTPMILSNIEVYKEIASDAAIYFNPYSVTSLSDILINIDSLSEQKRELIKKSDIIINSFSLNNMVNNTINVYKSII